MKKRLYLLVMTVFALLLFSSCMNEKKFAGEVAEFYCAKVFTCSNNPVFEEFRKEWGASKDKCIGQHSKYTLGEFKSNGCEFNKDKAEKCVDSLKAIDPCDDIYYVLAMAPWRFNKSGFGKWGSVLADCHDVCEGYNVSSLKWSKKAPKKMNIYKARKYCNRLNDGGYSDWRLPTISELRTLIQNCSATETGGSCKVADNCLSINKCLNDACGGCKGYGEHYSKFGDTEWFWSSSSPSDSKDVAWSVSFAYGGYIGSYHSGLEYDNRFVRCVH